MSSETPSIQRVFEASRLKRISVLQDELDAARAEAAHWKANHATEVQKNAVLRQRHDLPVDRLPVMREVEKLRTEVAELKARMAEAKRDAERLDSVERLLFRHHWDGTIEHPWTWDFVGHWRHVMQKFSGNSFRQAIDNAMKEEGRE